MIARSPTYIFPYDYVMDPHGFGVYETLPIEEADWALCTFPSGLSGQFTHGLFAHLASQEPYVSSFTIRNCLLTSNSEKRPLQVPR
jgi:hypothetical protein